MRYRSHRFRRAVADWFDGLSDVAWEVLIKLGLSAVVAALIWFLDHEVTGGAVDLPLIVCIIIGIVVVFGGWFVWVHTTDSG